MSANNKQYGLKEVANVTFYNVVTNAPEIFFDTLKVSTIENESESADATGGQGNGKLLSWDFGRTSTLNMQDALLSDSSLAMLAGTDVVRENIKVSGRDVITVSGGKATLEETPVGDIFVYEVSNGIMGQPVATFTLSNGEIEFTGSSIEDGSQVMVFYDYVTTNSDATLVTFSANKFPATYRVVGDTIVRGRDGVDRKMQFQIPQAKLQSSFSLTMEAENVSTFDFNLDILVEAGTSRLYDLIRL